MEGRQAKAGSVAAPGSLCACERLLQLRVWGDEQEYLVHGDRGATQYASALRAAVGNTQLCVATPYWASEVLRAVKQKGCAACAGRQLGRQMGDVSRPIQSTWAWPLLVCGYHEHGAPWSCKRFVRHACATWTETQGSSRSPGSVLLAH